MLQTRGSSSGFKNLDPDSEATVCSDPPGLSCVLSHPCSPPAAQRAGISGSHQLAIFVEQSPRLVGFICLMLRCCVTMWRLLATIRSLA